jgi:hypothetical protein
MPSAGRGLWLLVLGLVGLSPVAPAQLTPAGSELQANVTSAGFQTRPAAAADPSGNFVLVWQGPDGDDTGVFARLYGADGTPAGGEIPVNSLTSGCQRRPRVAMGVAGFAVTWEGEAGSGRAVYVRRFDASGSPLGPELRVHAGTAGDQRAPAVAVAPSGAFAVAWQSGGDVLFQRFSTSGSFVGAETVANVLAGGARHSPAIAYGPSGELLAVWQAQGQAGSGSGMFARRFPASGMPWAVERRLDAGAAPAARPAVGTDASGNFVVVWESLAGVRARRFSPAGDPLGGELVVHAAAAGDRGRPAVAGQGPGDFIAVWESRGGDAPQALGRLFDHLRRPAGGEVPLHAATAGARSAPGVAAGGAGRVVAAWESEGQDGDGPGIFAQRFDTGGLGFHTDTPCRVVDTRGPAGPLGGPALGSGVPRTFALAASVCGVPISARAVSVNVTVVNPPGGGYVLLYPGDASAPAASTMNFNAGQTRANNALLSLARDGSATLRALAGLAGGGQAHLLVDVNGYFE